MFCKTLLLYLSDSDNCDEVVCENNGTCINLGDRYLCECSDSFYGRECQYQVPSDIQPSASQCQGSTITEISTLIQVQTPPQATVTITESPVIVPVDSTGCEQATITEISIVVESASPCPTDQFGTTMTGLQTSAGCEQSTVTQVSTIVHTESASPCPTMTEMTTSMTPESCPTTEPCPTMEPEVDYCAGNPCQNNGTCFNSTTTYACACTSGWTGQTCEKGEAPIEIQLWSSKCFRNNFKLVVWDCPLDILSHPPALGSLNSMPVK